MVVKISSSNSINFGQIQSNKQPGILKKCLLIFKWRAGFLLLGSLIIFLGFMKMHASSLLLAAKEEGFHTANGVTSLSQSTKTGVHYDIVIDAGSTGSRIHIYKFSLESDHPVLLNEVFEQVRKTTGIFLIVFVFLYRYSILSLCFESIRRAIGLFCTGYYTA